MDLFTQVKSAEHMAKIIQHKWTLILNLGGRSTRSHKCIKRLRWIFTNTYICKCPFKNVIFFAIVRVQNVPENSSKFSLLGCLKTGHKLRSAMKKILWISNSLKDSCGKKSLPLSTKRKLSIVLMFPFPSVSFSGVFVTLKCETLVL